MHAQEKFSFNELLETAVNAGIGASTQSAFTTGKIAQSALEMSTAEVGTQFAEMAAGLREKFDPRTVITQVVASLASMQVDENISNLNDGTVLKDMHKTTLGDNVIEFGKSTASSLLQSVTTHLSPNIQQIEANVLGTTITNSIAAESRKLINGKDSTDKDIFQEEDVASVETLTHLKIPDPALNLSMQNITANRALLWQSEVSKSDRWKQINNTVANPDASTLRSSENHSQLTTSSILLGMSFVGNMTKGTIVGDIINDVEDIYALIYGDNKERDLRLKELGKKTTLGVAMAAGGAIVGMAIAPEVGFLLGAESTVVEGQRLLNVANNKICGTLLDDNEARDLLTSGMFELRPEAIRFTQPTVSPYFSNGQRVSEIISDLRNGSISAYDLPPIRVFKKDDMLFSIDNRRLLAFNSADIDTIPVQMVSLENPEIASIFKDRFDPILGKGDFVVIVNRAARNNALNLLSENNMIMRSRYGY